MYYAFGVQHEICLVGGFGACIGMESVSLLGIMWTLEQEVHEVFVVIGTVGAFVCFSVFQLVEVVV